MIQQIPREEIHKELDLIQSCIRRMADNSFKIKGWLMALYAVLFALLPKNIDFLWIYMLFLVFTICFWYLDAIFLRTERVYRKIYAWVLEQREHGSRELIYHLDPEEFKNKIKPEDKIIKVMGSRTLLWFYIIPLLIITIFFLSTKLG